MTRPVRSRLLWIPYAQRGCLYPVAPLIEALAARDVDILLVGPPSLAALAASVRVDFQPYTTSIDYDWSRRHQCDRHGLGPDAGSDWLRGRVTAEFAEVDHAVRSFRPDAMLADSFVVGAGLAAEANGASWASYVHYLFDETAQVDAMHRIWWESRLPEAVAYFKWWDKLRGTVGLGPEPRPREDAPWYRMSPQRTFLLGHPALHRRGARGAPGYVTRTSFPPWDEQSDSPLPAFESVRARVLVANSSAWQDDIDLLRAALEGLADKDVDVLLTVSAEHDLGTHVPPNVTVCGYLPHSRIIPEVDAVVSTAGYGIVSKALWWGRPLALAPRARDQHYVANAVERAGAGLRIAWPPEPEELRCTMETIITSVRVRERAQALAGSIAGYVDPERAAEMTLEAGPVM